MSQLPDRFYDAPQSIDGRSAFAFNNNALADGGAMPTNGYKGYAAVNDVTDFQTHNSRTMFDYPSMFGCENLDDKNLDQNNMR